MNPRLFLAFLSTTVLLAACTLAAGTAATYTILYLPTYAQTVLHMKASDSYLLGVFGSVISLAVTPLSAIWSDRIGRLLPSIAGVLLLLALAYPSFIFITGRSFSTPRRTRCRRSASRTKRPGPLRWATP